MRRLVQCIAMVGLLSLFAAAVAGMAWAITAGPDDMKGGALLAFVVAALLMMRGWLALLAKAGAHPLGVVVAGLVALFFAGAVPAAFSERAMHERGRFTACQVLGVTEMEGFNGAATVPVYRLDCDALGPLSIMESDRILQVNQRVLVHYDPEGGADARLAGDDEPVSGVDASVLAGVALGLLTLASLGLIVFGRPDS